MSGRDSSERVRFLRQAIADIEQSGQGACSARVRHVPMGSPEQAGFSFDRALGGLATGALYEVAPSRMSDLAAAGGFALGLAARFAASAPGAILWVSDEFSAHENGSPYAPGLARHGLDPARVVFVRTAGGQDLLWALEEAARCKGNAAVVADLWGAARLFDLVAARRITQAARASGAPTILIHPPASFRGAMAQNGARMRFEVTSRPSVLPSQAPRPVPGAAHWGVRFAKPGVEAGRLRGLDTELVRTIIWEHENGFFRDALSLALPAASGARTAAQANSA
ncbi:MAG: hypothetical protein K2X62_11090 [Beijerinckiaceae bacterium]|nr:hypothetical protein [Beijerinckiaceae bacterium]